MAANSKSRGIASFGKRVVTQICSSTSRDRTTLSASSLLSQRRAAHTSVYDKNPDEHISSSIVPDDVIPPQSDKYWSPHPKTGVFGPATEHNTTAGGKTGIPADGGESSVLEENAWFRPTSLEDLEKPHKL